MNEKEVDWRDLQLFLAVAREGGLSPASRRVGRSPATLSRRMLELEAALGCELFIRRDRGYELTRDGQSLLSSLADVENRVQSVNALSGVTERPLVKVSAGSWTTLALMPHLGFLQGDPADILIRFIAAEQSLDVSHREVTIGFRNKRPTQDSLVCRKLAPVEFAPYGLAYAPDNWIKVIVDTPSARWVEQHAGSDAVCEVNAPRNSLDLALTGVGVALLPTFIGDAQPTLIRRGKVVAELSHDRWLVVHQQSRQLPPVRRAIDRLCDVLA
ncbi:LysR family transcriptional regulator [Saccharospirillum sp. MSK14-1]|uniref:LysR family transcriptional regulator n=1 Tax=Saccharospirillum sp. MSK14-1 TaxID=1897632 RepID=UPI000D39114C|nr:LysR family transcriptional regulator [Saccharospirillum sp. MSK14-1]PTY38266.1 LysR family transcriptional regulator [Saccharospirillum sp. MSK14-1]